MFMNKKNILTISLAVIFWPVFFFASYEASFNTIEKEIGQLLAENPFNAIKEEIRQPVGENVVKASKKKRKLYHNNTSMKKPRLYHNYISMSNRLKKVSTIQDDKKAFVKFCKDIKLSYYQNGFFSRYVIFFLENRPMTNDMLETTAIKTNKKHGSILYIAARNRQVDLLKYFIQRGVDLNFIAADERMSPYQILKQKKSNSLFKELIDGYNMRS